MLCPVCSCTYVEYDGCLHCEQDREYECSLIADGGSTTDNPVGLTLDELRSTRVALLSNCDSVGRAAGNEGNMAGGAMHRAQDPAYQLSPSVLIFREQVSPPVPGSGEQALLIVSKLGQLELGAGVGVICEVYSLFWKEFSIVMTRGERDPFMQHDYFVEEWEAVGRVIVKGYVSISYIHTYIHLYLTTQVMKTGKTKVRM